MPLDDPAPASIVQRNTNPCGMFIVRCLAMDCTHTLPFHAYATNECGLPSFTEPGCAGSSGSEWDLEFEAGTQGAFFGL